MRGVHALVVARYVLVIVILLSLLGAAFSFGQYSVQGLVISGFEKAAQPDVKTYTKAVCSSQDGIRTCEDRLIVLIDAEEFVAENSEVRGSAQFLE